VTETDGDQLTEQASHTVAETGNVNGVAGLRTAQLQVLSRAFANIAHDIQNHLAAINESAGWMEDLLKLKNKKRFGWIRRLFKGGKQRGPDIRPFLDILSTIQDQVAQGSILNQRFSNFVHRQEETRSVFSAKKALQEIQDVLSEEAKKKGVHLEIKLADSTSMIETEPAGFQLAVFTCVEQVTEGLKSGDRLVLETEVSEGRFHVSLTSSLPTESALLPSTASDGQDSFRDTTEQLGGQVWSQPGDGNHVTTLAFPLAGKES